MVRSVPAPSTTPSLVNVQYETRTRAELSEWAISQRPRNKRLKKQLGLRANTDIEPGATITHFAFAPKVYKSEEAAHKAGSKHLYQYKGGFVAMLNPCPLLRTSEHRGVYCNHAGKGSARPANARMSALHKVKGAVAGQRIGFEATLFAKGSPIACREFVRVSYGPRYAAKIAATAAAQFEVRTGRNRHLKIGPRRPPAQEQAQLKAQTAARDLKKAAQVVEETARKAARPLSTLPERADRGKLKLQRWQ